MYVDCRLNAVGGKCSAIFERHALECLLRRSDGIPRKINMLCYSAMMAAFYAGENKISYRTAKKIAAEYHDAIAIESRRPVTWSLVMPALIAGAALGSVLLLGLVYPEIWSEWQFRHTVSGANERAVRSDGRATGHRKVSGSRHDAKAATSLTPHPVESHAPLAPVAAASAAPKSDVAAPASTPGIAILSTAPATAAVSTETQKSTGAGQRSQIIVKYGDTLEKIAIRYFGSASGLNALIAANPQLSDINQLSVGQIIYLPRGITPKASHHQTATAPAVPNAADSPAR